MEKQCAKKIIVLGVPYFTFSAITWGLKRIFSGYINTEIGGLFHTFFIAPTAPYWYLYCLFFVFLITPTFLNKKSAYIGFNVAMILKILSIFGLYSIYAVTTVLANGIWFVIGMCLCVVDFKDFIEKKQIGIGFSYGLALVFLVGSILNYIFNTNSYFFSFFLSLFACASILMIFAYTFRNNVQKLVFGVMAKYTMSIFLLHTLFAAPVRIVLFKIGIISPEIHVVFGIAISFIGPIAISIILNRIKWIEFFMYPNKYLKLENLLSTGR